VVELYAKPMQIEKILRDLKSPQYGMGLMKICSRCLKRYDVLLLIAMLAEILLWCIGISAGRRIFKLTTSNIALYYPL
jgi:hypothetical protein